MAAWIATVRCRLTFFRRSNCAVVLAVSAVITIVTECINAPASAAEPTSRPAGVAPSADALRAEIERLRRKAFDFDHPADHLAGMREEAERHDALARAIAEYLRWFPAEPDSEALAVLRFRALYWVASSRGDGYDALEAEITAVDAKRAGPVLKTAVDEWKGRLLRMRVMRQLVADGAERPEIGPEAHLPPPSGITASILEKFVKRHPESPQAVPMIGQLVEMAYDRGDVAAAEPWLALLEKHHPRDTMTVALRGEQALRLAVGKPWRPDWKTIDGKHVDWAATRGKVTAVLFWSPRYAPSTGLLKRLARFVAEHGPERVAVVAVAIDDDVTAVRAAASEVGHAGPLVCDGLGWRSPIAEQYGIRILPVALTVDAAGNLTSFDRMGQRRLAATVIERLRGMLGESPPVTTNVADTPPKGAPLPINEPRP